MRCPVHRARTRRVYRYRTRLMACRVRGFMPPRNWQWILGTRLATLYYRTIYTCDRNLEVQEFQIPMSLSQALYTTWWLILSVSRSQVFYITKRVVPALYRRLHIIPETNTTTSCAHCPGVYPHHLHVTIARWNEIRWAILWASQQATSLIRCPQEPEHGDQRRCLW